MTGQTNNFMSDASTSAPAALTEFPIRVLIVDDQRIIIEAVRRMVASAPEIEFHFVTDSLSAEETAVRIAPTVILQDLVMPDIDGFALIGQYRANPALAQVPVIVLSAKEDPKLKAQGFECGANDYMVKLPDQLELLARLRYHSAGYTSRLQRDQAFAMLRESQEQLAQANIELRNLAALDGLTGIANRRRFDEAIAHEWLRGQREQRPLSLLLCDIDCFKLYNDTNGHPAGDLCLKKVAAVLTEHLKRPADLAARYGGEEFAILLPDTSVEGALALAEACRAQLQSMALDHAASPIGHVTMSIGVASMVPNAAAGTDTLITRADKALYAAKHGGRDRVCQADID
ncbi:MAG: diguanylate cyclase domain-containing protein [Massilia sp.]